MLHLLARSHRQRWRDREMPKSTAIQAILSALRTERRANGVFDAPDHQHLIKIYFQAQENQIHLRGVLRGADCRPISGARDITRTITSEKLLSSAIDTMAHAVWYKWEHRKMRKNHIAKCSAAEFQTFFKLCSLIPPI